MNSPAQAGAEIIESKKPKPRHGLMNFLMLIATACWAGNIVVGKEALRGFTDLALAQLRVLGAALLFTVLFLAWPRRPAPESVEATEEGRWGSGAPGRPRLRRGGREWLFLGIMAACGVTLNQLFFISGIARTSAAHAGLVVALGPVMVLVISCSMRFEPLTVLKFLGMLISFSGVAVLTVGSPERGSGATWRGDAILLVGSAMFAVYTILVKEAAEQYDPLTLNFLTFALGALLMLPVGGLAVARVNWARIPPAALWSLLFMVVCGSLIAYLIFTYALGQITATRAAAFQYLQPFMVTSLAIWLLAERLTVRVMMGGPLILLGLYLTERERGEEGPATRPAPSSVEGTKE